MASAADSNFLDFILKNYTDFIDGDDNTLTPAAVATVHPQRVRFMFSFGGTILPMPHDNQLRYVGGETRKVAVNRRISYSALISKLSTTVYCGGATSFSVKYQLPGQDLDSLVTISTDEDLQNMMDECEHDHLKSDRLRVFLFPLAGSSDGESVLERGQSEVCSIDSDFPDSLFGSTSSSVSAYSTRQNGR